jgi:DNA invertase Pin-like site-specific DNA recombinase
MTEAVIYCRVSTEDKEKEGTSLQTQLEACRNYCQDKVYNIVCSFSETHSGLTLDHPQLNALREFVRSEQVDILVVYCLDRLTRNPVDGVILTQELEKHRVTLEAITEDVSNSELGKVISYIRSFASKLEAEKIRERTMWGNEANIKEEIDKILDMFDDADILNELEGPNYVRAAALAQKHEYPQYKIRWIQSHAIKEFLVSKNYQGLSTLIREYQLLPADLKHCLEEAHSMIVPPYNEFTRSSHTSDWSSFFQTRRNRDLRGVSSESAASHGTRERKIRRFFKRLFPS